MPEHLQCLSDCEEALQPLCARHACASVLAGLTCSHLLVPRSKLLAFMCLLIVKDVTRSQRDTSRGMLQIVLPLVDNCPVQLLQDVLTYAVNAMKSIIIVFFL